MLTRSKVPQRLFDALDRKDPVPFLRFWAALPVAGREVHPLGAFIWAALSEIGEQRMSNTEWIASSKRVTARLRHAEAATRGR